MSDSSLPGSAGPFTDGGLGALSPTILANRYEILVERFATGEREVYERVRLYRREIVKRLQSLWSAQECDTPSRSPSSPVPSSEMQQMPDIESTFGVGDYANTEIPASRGSEEELGKLLKTLVRVSQHIGAEFYKKGVPLPLLKEGEADLSISTAQAPVESYVSRLRDERDRLERFETYVCEVIAMGNQADLTVESLPR